MFYDCLRESHPRGCDRVRRCGDHKVRVEFYAGYFGHGSSDYKQSLDECFRTVKECPIHVTVIELDNVETTKYVLSFVWVIMAFELLDY